MFQSFLNRIGHFHAIDERFIAKALGFEKLVLVPVPKNGESYHSYKFHSEYTIPDCNHICDPKIEIPRYLSSLCRYYKRNVDALTKQLTPLDPACQMSICIPAKATEEHTYIYQTLKSLTTQDLPRKNFEVVITL